VFVKNFERSSPFGGLGRHRIKMWFFSEKVAMDWLKNVSNDDFNDFLPQLLEALKNETW
jgi:hypothetical protein